jgi:hypothetical protein|tara:strand:+ start:254 stop:532 length:279 start_codon:yes stop_codon:yes gene_type:complete
MDKPRIDKSGTKLCYDPDGKLHCVAGPAVEFVNGYTAWYQHGLRHRTDGPAIEHADGFKEWFLYNKWLSFDTWLDRVDISDEAKVMMKLQYG